MILIGTLSHRGQLIQRKQGRGGVTIVESLGLATAEICHGGSDQVKLQYTMGDVDMSARLQDS